MTSNKTKIYDVTLRESVYTSLEFNIDELEQYFKYISNINVCDIVELGYINKTGKNKILSTYNEQVILLAKEKCNKELSCMFHLSKYNESKEIWNTNILKNLSYIRIVLDSDISLLEEVVNYFNKLNIKVMINMSYMSRKKEEELIEIFKYINKLKVESIYIVDTNGSYFTEDVLRIYNLINNNTNISIGFHGHNHYNMVSINSYILLKNNIKYLDGTIGGYGKGAGNLCTELIETTLIN